MSENFDHLFMTHRMLGHTTGISKKICELPEGGSGEWHNWSWGETSNFQGNPNRCEDCWNYLVAYTVAQAGEGGEG